MLSRSAMPFLLGLAVLCAACGPKQAAATATPTAVQPPPQAESPAAPTSTVTPTAASAPTAAPASLEFTEPFDSNPAHWTFVQVDNGQAYSGPTVRDGFLVFDLPAPNTWGYAIYNAGIYAGVLLETQFQSRTAGDGAAGLVCNYDEQKGWYEFNVFQDGTYQLLFGQWLAAGVPRYTPLYQGESQAVRSDANVTGLECQENTLSPFINGEPERKLVEQRFALRRGKIGLSAASFADAPYTIAFDWVKVGVP